MGNNKKCQRCGCRAEIQTIGTTNDARILVAYHCFEHWDESFETTNRKDNLKTLLVSIESQELDLSDKPPG